MKSKTSIASKALIRDDWRRIWPLEVIFSIFLILTVTLPLRKEYVSGYSDASIPEKAAYFFATSSRAIPFYACILGIILSCILFFYLTKNQSTNLMHAMPIKRSRQYMSHIITGFEMISIGNLLVVVFSLLIESIYGGTDLQATLQYFLLSECSCLLYFSMGVFSVMITGWAMAAPAIYIGCNSIAVAISGLIMLIEEKVFYGFSGGSISKAVEWLTPVYQMGNNYGVFYNWEGNAYVGTSLNEKAIPTAVWYGIASLFIMAIALLLYKGRKSESAGDMVAFSCLKPIVKQIISFTGGLAIGLLLMEMIVPESENLWLLYLLAIGNGFLFVLACNMLIHKSAHVWNKETLFDGMILIMLLLIPILCIKYDVTNYQGWLPQATDVKRVMVSSSHSDAYIYVEDEDYAKDVINMHEALIKRGKIDQDVYFVSISYELKNGAEVSRSYPYIPADEESLLGTIETVVNSPKTKEADREATLTYPAEVNGGYFNAYGDKTISVGLSEKDTKELLEAIRKDNELYGTTDVSEYPYYSQAVLEVHYKDSNIMSIQLQMSDENTIAWLLDNGIIQDKMDMFGISDWYSEYFDKETAEP